MSAKTVMKIGLFVGFAYFVLVSVHMVFDNNISLLCLEIVTMLSGIYMSMFVVALPEQKDGKHFFKTMAVICAASCTVLTNVVHCIHIAAIKPLAANGIAVPEYLQVGTWPSILMATDYLGWGLFMGLAFIFSGFFIATALRVRWLLFLCGCLCFVGFLGSFISIYLWFAAPMGYGVGAVIVALKLLFSKEAVG